MNSQRYESYSNIENILSADELSENCKQAKFVSTIVDKGNTLMEINGNEKKKRSRLTISCLTCKTKKIKCDRVKPICGSCKRHNKLECKYQSSLFQEVRKPKKLKQDNEISVKAHIPPLNVQNVFQIDKKQKNSHIDISDSHDQIFRNTIVQINDILNKVKDSDNYNDDIAGLKDEVNKLQEKMLTSESKEELPYIIKALSLLRNLKVKPMYNNTTSIMYDNIRHFFGATSISSFLDSDTKTTVIFKKVLSSITEDAKLWDSLFSPQIYSNSLERKISVESVQLIGSCVDGELDFKTIRFHCICNHLERYFIDYETFMDFLAVSYPMMNNVLPLLTRDIICTIANRHFISDEFGKLRIINNNEFHDIVEITCILAIIRFGLIRDAVLSKVPDHLNFNTFLENESIKTDIETDLLHSFIKIIINDFKLQNYNSLLTLTIFACLFLIKLADRTTPFSRSSGINFAVIAIYISLAMGIFKPGEALVSQISGDSEYYFKSLTENDFKNIKAIVVVIDTMNSFSSGMPQLVSVDLEELSETDFFKPDLIRLSQFYRSAYRLVNAGSLIDVNQKSINKFGITNSNDNDTLCGLKERELLIQSYESFATSSIKVLGVLVVQQLQFSQIATITRTSNLLCYFYANSYRVVAFNVSEMEKDPDHDPDVLRELKILEVRSYRRCLRQSILKLVMLNFLLTNVFNRPEYISTQNSSVDLIQMFTRTVFTFSVTVLKLIIEKRNNTSFYQSLVDLCLPGGLQTEKLSALDIFNLRFEILDEIREYGCRKSDSTVNHSEEIKNLSSQLDQIIISPTLVIETILGFYFNCSQSVVSQSFEFILSYKYMALLLKSFEESGLKDIDEFDFDAWVLSMKNVNITWFAKC